MRPFSHGAYTSCWVRQEENKLINKVTSDGVNKIKKRKYVTESYGQVGCLRWGIILKSQGRALQAEGKSTKVLKPEQAWCV